MPCPRRGSLQPARAMSGWQRAKTSRLGCRSRLWVASINAEQRSEFLAHVVDDFWRSGADDFHIAFGPRQGAQLIGQHDARNGMTVGDGHLEYLSASFSVMAMITR